VMSSAGGLVFAGDVLGHFSVFDAETGALLKQIQTGTAIMAAPMSYDIAGEQYIAVTAGWGGGGWPYVPRGSAAYQYSNRGRLLVFKLDGGEVPMPEPLPPLQVAPAPPPQQAGITEANIAHGRGLFFGHCILCHASQQRTVAADLRRMEPATHTVFDKILLEGLYLHLGMPRWDDVFSVSDVGDIQAYLIDEQARVHQHEMALQSAGKPLDAMSSGVLSSY